MTGRHAGRPRGAKNKRTRELMEQAASAAAAIEKAIPDAFAGDAHALLMTIYKNPNVELSFRLDAAKAAAPYEKPKLASTEIKGDNDKLLEHKLTIEFIRAAEKEAAP